MMTTRSEVHYWPDNVTKEQMEVINLESDPADIGEYLGSELAVVHRKDPDQFAWAGDVVKQNKVKNTIIDASAGM